jgi:hypothetical protein
VDALRILRRNSPLRARANLHHRPPRFLPVTGRPALQGRSLRPICHDLAAAGPADKTPPPKALADLELRNRRLQLSPRNQEGFPLPNVRTRSASIRPATLESGRFDAYHPVAGLLRLRRAEPGWDRSESTARQASQDHAGQMGYLQQLEQSLTREVKSSSAGRAFPHPAAAAARISPSALSLPLAPSKSSLHFLPDSATG